MDRRVKVLLVDDSAAVRTVLARRLAQDPEIEVVGYARDGLEALEKVESLRPDVITLDVAMPRLDGLRTLEMIMAQRPTPVIMVSAMTSEGAAVTIQALEMGAVDFVLKPTRGGVPAVHEVVQDLCAKVKLAAAANLSTLRRRIQRKSEPPASGTAWRNRTVVIGASTGGPQALRTILSSLPPDMEASILVVQHMPPGFTRSLAERLDESCPLPVEEAHPGSRVQAGRVLIAPGGRHMTVAPDGSIQLHHGPTECGVRPAVNVTMESVAAVYGPASLGVILTGMGSDGTRGAGLIKAAGGEVIAEAESTCVIYGMPRSVAQAGYVDGVLPLPRIAAEIVRRCRAPARPAEARP